MLEPEHLGLMSSTPVEPAPVDTARADSTPPCVDFAVPGSDPASDEIQTLAEVEKRHIFKMLDRCHGNRTHAAQMMDISIRTLRNKLHEYNGSTPSTKEELLASTN